MGSSQASSLGPIYVCRARGLSSEPFPPPSVTMSGLANPTSPAGLAAIKAIIPQTLGADLLGTLFGLVCVVLPWMVVFC